MEGFYDLLKIHFLGRSLFIILTLHFGCWLQTHWRITKSTSLVPGRSPSIFKVGCSGVSNYRGNTHSSAVEYNDAMNDRAICKQ